MSDSCALGTLLLASGIGVLTAAAARADAVVELKTSRVIELRAQDRHGRVPVVSSVAMDPTNRLLATAGDDHLVRIWDASRVMTGEWSVVSGSKSRLSTHHSPLATLRAHTDWVQAAVFSPDGKVLATAGRDRQIKLWRVSTGRPLRSFSPSVHGISQLAFSPDGSMLAAAGFENKVWVYDAAKGRSLWVREAPGPDIRALAFAPGGKQLAAAGRSGRIRIWKTSGGRRAGDLAGHHRRVRALAYSPDGKRLASAGEGQSIRLWDVSAASALAVLPSRPCKILSLVFCGSDRLAAGGSDDLIRVWDLATRSEQLRLVGHTGSVSALAWDPQAEVLISGSFDTTVRLWPLRSNMDVISRR